MTISTPVFSDASVVTASTIFVIDAAAKLAALAFEYRKAEAICKEHQSLSDLGLEKYDDRDADIEHGRAEYELKCCELLRDREPVEQSEQDDTRHRRHGARAAEQFQNHIDEDKYESDVEHAPKSIYRRYVLRILHLALSTHSTPIVSDQAKQKPAVKWLGYHTPKTRERLKHLNECGRSKIRQACRCCR